MRSLENVPGKLNDIWWIKAIGWTAIAAALTVALYLFNQIEAIKENIEKTSCRSDLFPSATPSIEIPAVPQGS